MLYRDYATNCVVMGNKILSPCEADVVLRVIDTHLSSSVYPEQLRKAGVVKAASIRQALGMRSPYRQLASVDRSDRLSEVFRIIADGVILSPLSSREARELDEVPRYGSLLRVLDLSLLERWSKGAEKAVTDNPEDRSEPVQQMSSVWPALVPRPDVAAPILMPGWRQHPDHPNYAYMDQRVVPIDEVRVRVDTSPAVSA